MSSLQLICVLISIIMLSLIDVSKAHTKNRLCHLLCCGENEHLDLKTACDESCNECKSNDSVGGVCERRISKNKLRGCSKNFTCAVTCRNECNSVGIEDDESMEALDFGSGDSFRHVNAVTCEPRISNSNNQSTRKSKSLSNLEQESDDAQNPPQTYDSSWQLTNVHVILIITAVCLCFMIVCMLLFFAVRFVINERKLALPINRGQYPPAVFYTSGKMTTIGQGSIFNQPSSDFPNGWC